jgi:hypothetical protein
LLLMQHKSRSTANESLRTCLINNCITDADADYEGSVFAPYQ